MVVLVLLVCFLKLNTIDGAMQVVENTMDEEREDIALSQLSEEQVDAALDNMTSANLVQIIESVGYSVESGMEPVQLLKAAKMLVKQERDRQIAEKAKPGRASSTALEDSDIVGASGSGSPKTVNGGESKQNKNRTNSRSESETQSTPSNAEAVRGWTHTQPIPEGATFWDLFQSQVAADLGPFLRIIPEPIRKVFQQHSKVMAKPMRQALCGAIGPMLRVAGKLINVAGHGLIHLGSEVSTWSSYISTLAQVPQKVGSTARTGVTSQHNDLEVDIEEDDGDVIEL